MKITSPNRTIMPNQTFTLNSPIASQTAQPWAVEFSNYSGLTITVITGFGQLLIPPYTVNTVSDPTGEFPPIMTLQTANSPLGVSPNASQTYLQAVWVTFPDSFSGQYPHATIALPASSSAPSIVGPLFYNQSVQGNIFSSPVLDVSNFQSIGVSIDNTAGPSTGHVELVLFWQNSTSPGATTISEVFIFTAQLASAFLLPIKGPLLTVQLNAPTGNGVISTLILNGYTTPVPNIVTIPTGGLPYVFSVDNLPIAASTNSGPIGPSFDCFGPVTVGGAMGNLQNATTGGVIVQITDLDNTPNVKGILQFPILPSGLGAFQPFTVWLSRFRHQIIIFNDSNAAITAAYLNMWANI